MEVELADEHLRFQSCKKHWTWSSALKNWLTWTIDFAFTLKMKVLCLSFWRHVLVQLPGWTEILISSGQVLKKGKYSDNNPLMITETLTFNNVDRDHDHEVPILSQNTVSLAKWCPISWSAVIASSSSCFIPGLFLSKWVEWDCTLLTEITCRLALHFQSRFFKHEACGPKSGPKKDPIPLWNFCYLLDTLLSIQNIYFRTLGCAFWTSVTRGFD